MELDGCPWYVKLYWQSFALVLLVLVFIARKYRHIRNRRADLFWLSYYAEEKREKQFLEERINRNQAEKQARMQATKELIERLGIK
jgi:hypothetical protein